MIHQYPPLYVNIKGVGMILKVTFTFNEVNIKLCTSEGDLIGEEKIPHNNPVGYCEYIYKNKIKVAKSICRKRGIK